MKYSGSRKRMALAIRPYGLFIVPGDHPKIVTRQGRLVVALGSTPSCPFFAENAIHELVRRGYLPASMKRLRIRG